MEQNKMTIEEKERLIQMLVTKFNVDELHELTTLLQKDKCNVEILPTQNVSDMLCGSFDADNSTSSATKCKCGREKWEHPKPRSLHSIIDSQFIEPKKDGIFTIKRLPELPEIWIDPKEPIINYKKHNETCAKNRKKRKKRKRR